MVKATAARIQSTEAVRAEVTKVQHILDGSSEGRVKNGSERAALVAVLTALCPAPADNEATQELAEDLTEFLANFYKYARPPCPHVCCFDCACQRTANV